MAHDAQLILQLMLMGASSGRTEYLVYRVLSLILQLQRASPGSTAAALKARPERCRPEPAASEPESTLAESEGFSFSFRVRGAAAGPLALLQHLRPQI